MHKSQIVKVIHLVDALLVVNLPRSILATLAYRQDSDWQMYAKVRQVSVYVFWLVLAMLQFLRIHSIIFLESSSEEVSSWTYIRELMLVVLVFVSALVDNRLCRYVNWEVSRRQSEKIEAEKSQLDELIKHGILAI